MKYAHAPPSKVPPLWSFVDTQNTNSAGALPEVQQPVLEQTEKKCYKCSTPLTLSNITLYRVTHHNYLCRKCQGTYAKEWRRKNLERPVTKWFLDKNCKKCGIQLSENNMFPSHIKNHTHTCRKCGTSYGVKWREKNSTRVKANRSAYRARNRDYARKKGRDYWKMVRTTTMKLIMGQDVIHCIYCGCDYLPFLEINHKNGGGSKEKHIDGRHKSIDLHQEIYQHRRSATDLEITCRVCNAWHYLKLKEPGKASGFSVNWKTTMSDK